MPPRILGTQTLAPLAARHLAPGQFRELVWTAARSHPSFLETVPLTPSLRDAVGKAVERVRGGLSPDEFAAARAAGPAPAARTRFPLADTPTLRSKSEDEGVFHDWIGAQLNAYPELKAAWFDLAATAPPSPQSLQELYDAARASVRRSFEAAHGEPPPPHLEALWSFQLLAGYGMQHGSERISFPRYLWDGRDQDGGGDKAAHFFCQGAYAAGLRYDRMFGTGAHADALESVVDRDNWNRIGDAILDADARAPFTIGPLEGRALGGPPQPKADYHPDFPPQADATPEEARAIRYAELLGALHEANDARSGLPFDVDRLGRHPEWDDPLARTEQTIPVLWGLSDPGVREELRANSEGAKAAVRLMRDPSARLNAPFDGTDNLTFAAYAQGPKGDWPSFYAQESTLLARLHSALLRTGEGAPKAAEHPPALTGSDALAVAAPHEAWARTVPPDVALEELLRKVGLAVDHLAVQDRERLAHYYANLCTRMIAYRIGETHAGAPRFEDHLNFARSQPAPVVAEHIANRLRAVAAQY